MGKRYQYALVNKSDDSPVNSTHQDDSETALVSDTLAELLDLFGDWSDYGADQAVRELAPGGEFADYKIVRQEVVSHDLDESDLAILAAAGRANESDESDDEETDPDDEDDSDA